MSLLRQLFFAMRMAALSAAIAVMPSISLAQDGVRDSATGLTATEMAMLSEAVLRKANFLENASIGNVKSTILDAAAHARVACGMIASRTNAGKANPLHIFLAVIGRENGKVAVDVIAADSGDAADAHLKTCRARGIQL